jgi:hypothetical protein
MAETSVDRLYQESVAALAALPADAISLHVSTSDIFRKALLIGAASYFEMELARVVTEYVHEASGGASRITSLVKAKAIERQFHTWFDWNNRSAGKFFAMFGEDFKALMTDELKRRADLKAAVAAFIEVCAERNPLAHGDFASYPMEKTMDEVYARYKAGIPFLDAVAQHLRREAA